SNAKALQDLRDRAEAAWRARHRDLRATSHEDLTRVVHELEVHQIELELQNEELRRAQDEAEAARQQFSDLYDFAPVGYLTINQDARITQANLTAATMLGIERHRLVGQRFAVFVQRESQDDLYLALRAGPPDGRSWSGEILLRKADGTALPVSIEIASVVEPDRGRFWRCVLSDITNKKSAEEARRRYAAIVEYSNDAILSADLDGRLVSWNPAA